MDTRKAKKRPQGPNVGKLPSKEVDLVLLYTGKTKMDLDADQFVQYPRILEEREPSMKPYGISLKKVEIVDKKDGTPPAVKHELHLKLTIEGMEKNIQNWETASQNFVKRRTTVTASEALRDYHASKEK